MTDTDRDVDRRSDGGTRDADRDRTDADRTRADADRTGRAPNPRERGKWISALVALLGVWMVAQAVLFELAASQFWNDVVVGALLLAIGGYNFSRRTDERLGSMGGALLVALIGLWLIASPMMFGADGGFTEAINEAGFWNDVVVGLVALVLGAYSAYAIRNRRRATRTATT